MSDLQKCFNCKNQIDTPMDNGDGKTRCIKCSTEKYKADHPFTWKTPVFKSKIFIDICP